MDPARDALIVAVSDYRDPKLRQLRAPVADASALGRVLEDPSVGGFRVQLALDEDESALTRRLARFFSDRRPEDLLLIHFSCHGIKDASGELYMAAADTETDLLSATGIPSRWLSEQIAKCRSKRIVVLLDCCFSGSFAFGTSFRAGDHVNVQQHLEGRGRVVITASNAMEYSFEGDELSGAGQPSIFTAAVVEGLETGEADRDGDRLVSVDELYDYVFDRVRETTPNQSPTKLSSLEGPLYIARSQYERPVEPAALPQELVDLVHHPYAEARLGAVAELSRLLASDNPGARLSARLTLESMAGDDSRKVSDRVREVLSQRSITGPVAVEEVREQLASGAAEETAPELETEAPPAPAGTDEGVAPTVPSPPARQPVPSPPPPIPLAAPAREPSVSIGYLRAIGPADRQHATAVIVGGLALSALGALLGAVLSYSMLHSAGYLGNATAVAAIAIATAPLVIALMALSVWSRSAAFSAALALGGFLAGTGIASLTGLIHYSNNPRMYFIIVNVIAGLGLGVASICLRRELRTMLIALGLGALGGLVAGAVTPIAVFTHRGAWTATQTLSGVIGAAPLCVLIAFLPRASRVARAPSELEPSAAGESPATS